MPADLAAEVADYVTAVDAVSGDPFARALTRDWGRRLADKLEQYALTGPLTEDERLAVLRSVGRSRRLLRRAG